MSKTNDFISKFHAIQGVTLSDRRRNFNQLLGQLHSDLTSEEDLKSFIAALTPKTRLEEGYKLDILISFNRNEDLLQILKAGDPFHIKKVLNFWKFFHSTFLTIDEDALINDVFPHTSFSTRMKVINRLYKNLKNEEKADAYFKAIEEKYGLKVASAILPGCSLDLIKAIVKEYNLKLTSRHLLKIVKKDPKFLDFYFELLDDNFDFSDHYKQVLKYIAKVNPGYYWELFDKHKVKVKFGKQMTLYVLEANKDISKQDVTMPNYFNHRQMMRVLKLDGNALKEFVLLHFPKSLYNFNFAISDVLKFIIHISKRQQYQVLSECFVEVYKKKIIEEPRSLPEDLLRIIPANEREIILDVRVPNDDSLIYLYPPKKSIAMLKEKIRHTSEMEKRGKLLYQLIETCKICNDSDSLLLALKYFLFRHKNDLTVLIEFMRKLIKWPSVEKLSAEHWKCINELLNVLKVSGKYSNREFNFMEKYLQYLWENELPYDEHIRAFLKYIAENQHQILVFEKQWKYMKICLEHFAALIPQMFEGDKYKGMCGKLLTAMMEYNMKNSKDPILINHYAEIISTMRKDLAGNYYSTKNINNYIVKFAYEKDGIYDPFFWDNYKVLHTCQMVIWYIKTDPLKILENIDKLFSDLPNSSQCSNLMIRWWHNRFRQHYCLFDEILEPLSKYSNLDIPEKLIDFALLTLQHEETNPQVTYAAVKVLSHLGTHSQYLKAFETSDDKTRKYFVKNLRDLRSPSAGLLLLLKFCVPKYIVAVQKSLYSIISNTPEKLLAEFFAALYKSSASVKKHAINLTITTTTKEGIYNFLKQAGANETTPSLKKIIFRLTMKYFAQNPSDMFWDLLKSNINLIDPKDREAHDFLLNLKKIPPAYHLQYISLIYELLSKSADKMIEKKKFELINHLPRSLIEDLDLVFTKKIIIDTVFNPDLQDSHMEWIGLRFVFYAKNENQSKMLQAASENLRNYVKLKWDGPARITVYNYLMESCKNFINLDLDVELIDEFQKIWSSIFNREDVFEESLLLDFTSAYVKGTSQNKLVEFAVKTNEILDNLVRTYDGSIVDLFAEALHQFLHKIACVVNDEEKMVKFLESFCITRKSPHTFLVVMMVSMKIGKIHGESVLKMIQQCEAPAVRIFLKHYAAKERNASFSCVF